MALDGAMDLAAAGEKVLLGNGGGTAPDDPFAQAVVIVPEPQIACGYQQIAVNTAQSLTVPTGATSAIIVPEGQDVRWRDDGSAPTTSVGMPLGAGATLFYRANLATVQFIGVDTGGKINVSYYK